MSENDYSDGVASKRFKSSNANNEESSNGENGDEKLFTSNPEAEAGSYYLGPIVKRFVRAPVTQYLARKKETDEYYLMKILELKDEDSSDKCSFMKRSIFHNEFSILSLLVNQPGVIQLQDFFKEYAQVGDGEQKIVKLSRVCMVLECLIPHSHYNTEYVRLHHYVREDKLSESEALRIFYNFMVVLEDLHKRNIVHRDLRLSNIILNRKTLKVKLIDFYYARLLPSETALNFYQSRTLSVSKFIESQQLSPKANDMWSAGIILYAMLNGCMPFTGASNYMSFLSTNRSLHEFYLKIMSSDCKISKNLCISKGTKDILKGILCKNPHFRLTASKALDMVSSVLALHRCNPSLPLYGLEEISDQIVPNSPGLNFEVERDYTPKFQSLEPVIVEPEVTEEQENLNEPPTRVESVIKRAGSGTIPSGPPQQNEYSANSNLRYAMVQLGVTNVNNINALCFAYYTRRTYLD